VLESIKTKIMSLQFIVFDFDGVFTDNLVYISESGQEFVVCNRSDGLGLSKIRGLNIPMYVISTEKNPVVTYRCKKLEINCIQGCDNKLITLNELLMKKNINIENVAYIGNDINDQQCLQSVGLPIVVKDAHPDVLNLAQYTTKNLGGHGAVREVCDLIYNVRSK
jgi:3-deoxy-D-manno-octulosonate 8-phosphate phosphatase (KDO 8-P phosphatase)